MHEAWAAYVEALRGILNDAARQALREETLEQSQAVAEAAGGFLGLGSRVSDAEKRVLEEISSAF